MQRDRIGGTTVDGLKNVDFACTAGPDWVVGVEHPDRGPSATACWGVYDVEDEEAVGPGCGCRYSG